jgi:hypothetical protein
MKTNHRLSTSRAAMTVAAAALSLAGFSQTIYHLDPTAERFPINPNIYGVSYMTSSYSNLTTQQIQDLNTPLVRYGGNLASSYNWLQNADNHGSDVMWESIIENNKVAGGLPDLIFGNAKAAGATAMITLPMMNYVANLGVGGAPTYSFSVKKYGAQIDSDGDIGSGIAAAGNPKFAAGAYITGNNPLDAYIPLSASNNGGSLANHMVGKWGSSLTGGVKYYIMDNEPASWYGTHRDVHPNGETMNEILSDYQTNVAAVHSADANAQIVGPEDTNWASYFYDGSDLQWANVHGWNPSAFPDRKAHGNMDYVPWLLSNLHKLSQSSGKPMLNVFSLHWYPQGDEYDPGESQTLQDSASNQTARNKTTRSLWDPTYEDPDLTAQDGGSPVYPGLIPMMSSWINSYYPGLQKGITEYNWGDEAAMNGATAQADVLGIFGKTQLDLANRWGVPAATTPTYQAMKMFRNYDGLHSTFGDISVGSMAPNPDQVSIFSSIRSTDGAMTIMAINKSTAASSYKLSVMPGFNPAYGRGGEVPFHLYQLTSANPSQIVDKGTTLQPYYGFYDGTFDGTYSLPAQSISLFVIAANEIKYNFEIGSTEGWSSLSSTVAVSTTQNAAYTDFASLACQLSANTTSSAVTSEVGVNYPALVAGETVSAEINVPTAATQVKLHICTATQNFYSAVSTTTTGWQQLSYKVPATVVGPITSLRVEFIQAAKSAASTAYVDDITW